MSQGVLCQKITFLGQKLWPVACEQTHKHTNRHQNGYWVPYQGFSLSELLPMIWAVQLWILATWAPFALFERAPELIKNGHFQKLQFLQFYFVTLSLLTKHYVYITKTTAFSPLGPLKAQQGPFKGPLNSSKSKIFKRNIFSLHCFVRLSQHTNRLCLYAPNYVFWLLGPFLKIKGPLKGAEMQIFKNRWKPHVMVS